MRSRRHSRAVAVAALSCLLAAGATASSPRQGETAASAAVLLARARTLETRGRLDLAAANWNQVLTQEPNQPEALAGLVRAARAAGRPRDAAAYLARLQASHPDDPALAQLGAEMPARDLSSRQRDADRLIQVHDYAGAMVVLRDMYGATPPAGAPAILFYETEAELPDSRPQAIAGLRALADRYPADTRYTVALGKVLLGNARTAAEGRTLLDRVPAGSQERQISRTAKPAASSMAVVPAPQPATASTSAVASAPAAVRMVGQSRPPHQGSVPPSATAAPPRSATLVAADSKGFVALNAHRFDDADHAFRSVLAQDNHDAKALAGEGYVQVHTGDLRAAVRSFEQAQENGDHSLALTRALVDAQYTLELQRAAALQRNGDRAGAITAYRAASAEKPSNPDALEGLGTALLDNAQPAEAVPIFRRLTQVRSLSPAAWEGLVLAEARAGQLHEAQATYTRVPADVRGPLQADTALQQALFGASARPPAQMASAGQPAPLRQPAATAPTQLSAAPSAQGATSAVAVPSPPKPARTQAAPSRSALADGPRPSQRRPAVAVPVAPPPVVSKAVPTPTPVPAERAPGTELVLAHERREQADALFRQGEYVRAADLYRDALTHEPGNSDAWRGLILALHRAGRNGEAAAVLPAIPPDAHPTLDADATLQADLGEILAGAGRPGEALQAYARAQTIYASQRLQPPLDLELRLAALLAMRNDDLNLYQQLIYLGNRTDTSDEQRRAVQMIWTEWATRRARLLAVAGDRRRAVVLLNAAAEAFGGNARVMAAVAAGYAGIGLPREAVALYRAQDLTQAPASEIEAAVSAAVAARDRHAAEQWVRLGRERFPNDPGMLTAASELEQYRGHEDRAVQLSAQAKALAPAQDPSRVLTAELREGVPDEPAAGKAGKLSVLLAPAAASPGAPLRPFLPAAAPGSTAASVPIPLLVGYGSGGR